MLQDFQNTIVRPFSIGDVFMGLLVACVCGFAISLCYRWTYRGSSYAPTFVRSLIFLAMITAVVLLVIGNNLARAFGLVGAMSIIRFRTPVKDAQDIVFIFFSLAVGMAAGVGRYEIAFVATLFISLVILLTAKGNYATLNKQALILQFTYEGASAGDAAAYVDVLSRHCKHHELINVRADGAGERLDLTFYVTLRDDRQRAPLIHTLAALPEVRNVNLFYDTEP